MELSLSLSSLAISAPIAGIPDLALLHNFAGMTTGDTITDFTFTRSTAATYWDAEGLLQSAAINAMRISRDPVSGEMGYLAEPQRTNLLLQSILPGGGATPTGWSALFSTGSGAVASSLFGSADGASAYTFTCSGTRMVFSQNVALSNNTTYCYSIWVESVTGALGLGDIILPSSLPAGCTITGWAINGVAGTSATTVVAGVASVTIGGTYTGASTTFRLGCGASSTSTGTVVLSRPQLEAGSYPTSYIPTTTGTVTRGADLLTHTLSGANATALSTAGTMVCRFSFLGGGSAVGPDTRAPLRISNGTTAERHLLYNASGNFGGLTTDNSVGQAAPNVATPIAVNTPAKAAYAWSLNSVNVAVNGAAGTLDASATMPTVDRVEVGGPSGSEFGGLIHSVSVYTSRLPDATLQALTA